MSGIVAKMNSYDDIIAGSGVDDKAISKAETELGIKFAEEYVEYLQHFGIAAVNGHELTGLGSSKRVDVLDVTLSKRGIMGDQMNDYYVIEELNIDGIIVWQSENGEIIVSTEDGNTQKAFSSLCEYISS